MKLTGLLPVAVAVVALSLLAACGDSQPPASKAPAPKAEPVQSVPPVAAWPPPAPPDTPVAQDLLADNWEFVIDASGSMGSSACGTGGQPRMETAKSGVITFNQSLPEKANRGLVVFSERSRPGIQEWLKLGSGNRAEFTRLVSRILPQGGTPLRSSIQLAAKVLTTQAQMQRGYGTYHLVVVTDGEADEGEGPGPYTKNLVTTTAITVHVIGFCVDGKHSLDLKGYTQYASASNPATLEKGLKAILAESSTFTDSKFPQ
ncbi:MAG TPA: vWA domain-containing protein [Candidatus Eremiobacteraceae bacterium]|nr:vWA domain-containing protein [Candidatus Eremiobacteraceae bacterium]